MMNTSAPQQRARRLSPRLVGIAFGCGWGVLAGTALPAASRPFALTAVLLVGIILVWRLRRQMETGVSEPSLFRTRAYRLAVTFELMALLLASVLLPRFGLSDDLYAVTGLIVGLHFLGLWWGSRNRRFVVICAAMCVVSLVSLAFPPRWHAWQLRSAFLGAGNALALWWGAGWER